MLIKADNLDCCLYYTFQISCHCEPAHTLVWQSVSPVQANDLEDGTDCHVAALLAMTVQIVTIPEKRIIPPVSVETGGFVY